MFLREATSLLSGRVCTSARVSLFRLVTRWVSFPFELMVLVNQTRRSSELVADQHMACRDKIIVSSGRGKKAFFVCRNVWNVSFRRRSDPDISTIQHVTTRTYTCLAYSRAIHASVSMKFGNTWKLADDSPAERRRIVKRGGKSF